MIILSYIHTMLDLNMHIVLLWSSVVSILVNPRGLYTLIDILELRHMSCGNFVDGSSSNTNKNWNL